MKPARVVIRKYGNRRLYNTAGSRYINLEELADLVRNGNDVQVVDARTGEDLTRITLTQIIVEDAKDQGTGLPLEFLRQLVIASDKIAHEGFMWFKPALNAFEGALESSLRRAGSATLSPLEMMKNLVSSPSSRQSGNDELQQLKRRVEQLESGRTKTRKRAPRRKAAASR